MTHRNRRDVAPVPAADGSIVRQLIDPDSSVLENQSLGEITLWPAQPTAEHFHRESEEILYILRGKGRIELGGSAFPLHAGDAIPSQFAVAAGDVVPIRVGDKHRIRNVGTQNLVLLCCSSPARSERDTEVTA